ncbi:ABC transporter permease [Cohnella sp.]|uniref:ABC transporter permease n=1 Tax=Cohnella sp. TaxID=1883426 RepID=UPI003564718C
MRAITAELSKLLSLLSVWVALAIGLIVPTAIVAINSVSTRKAIALGDHTAVGIDMGYQELAFGVIGAIIIGVIAVSSEYFTESGESGGGRQITTSLIARPSRLRFLLAKATAVAMVSAVLASASAVATMAEIRIFLGEHAPELGSADVPRLAGIVCYWVLSALLAFGITVLTRHGIVPLAILIVNTSVVTVTYLLTRITSLAYYFPDMAGIRMFIRNLDDSTVEMAPLVGGLVMTAWVAALLTIAAIVFCRRDA